MKSRRNYLRYRKNQFKWKQIGWHSDSICSICGQKASYQIYNHDAWCCASCNEWLDEACGEPDCPFCSGRPETPYEVYVMTDVEAGSAGKRKFWRRKNYQHKMHGRVRAEKRRAVKESLIKNGATYERRNDFYVADQGDGGRASDRSGEM